MVRVWSMKLKSEFYILTAALEAQNVLHKRRGKKTKKYSKYIVKKDKLSYLWLGQERMLKAFNLTRQ